MRRLVLEVKSKDEENAISKAKSKAALVNKPLRDIIMAFISKFAKS